MHSVNRRAVLKLPTKLPSVHRKRMKKKGGDNGERPPIGERSSSAGSTKIGLQWNQRGAPAVQCGVAR